MIQEKPKPYQLTKLKSLTEQQRELLVMKQGIRTIDMLISLATTEPFRQEIISMLQITQQDFETIINEARSYYTSNELSDLCQIKPILHPMGLLNEADRKDRDPTSDNKDTQNQRNTDSKPISE